MNEIGKFRLPTVQELLSIVDYTKYNPATNLEGMKSAAYWSSTSDVSDLTFAWGVCFYHGYDSVGYDGHNHYVRCVRTLENNTLEWAKEDAPRTMTLKEAIEYADSLNTQQHEAKSINNKVTININDKEVETTLTPEQVKQITEVTKPKSFEYEDTNCYILRGHIEYIDNEVRNSKPSVNDKLCRYRQTKRAAELDFNSII